MKNIAFITILLALISILTSGRAFILQVSPDEEIIRYVEKTTQPTVELTEVVEITNPIEEPTEETVGETVFIEETIDETEQIEITEPTKEQLEEQTEQSEEEVQKPVQQINSLYTDDYSYANFYGRLYIPSVEIDVALYYEMSQSATDRADSAAIFTYGSYGGEIIADHNNQDFGKLFDVSVGTTGYIQLSDGNVINIKCVDVINGHNTGTELTDENYNIVMGKYDYLMYTCRNGWKNIRICQWNCY